MQDCKYYITFILSLLYSSYICYFSLIWLEDVRMYRPATALQLAESNLPYITRMFCKHQTFANFARVDQ